MNKFYKILFLLLLSFIILPHTNVIASKDTSTPENIPKLFLKIDRYDTSQLPRNFRTSNDAFKGLTKDGIIPSRLGMNKLNESGSSAFSEKEFEKILETVPVSPNQFYDIDLRGESHGYLDGICVSWFGPHNWGNANRTQDIITHIEKDQLKSTLTNSPITLYTFDDNKNKVIDPIKLRVYHAYTEEQMVKNHGAHYFRLTLMDHFRPDDQAVDKFINFYKTLPQNAWLHYHCYAGMGRTTIFMVMHDILKNAQTVSFDDIIKRQSLIGIVDLSNIPEKKKDWGRKAYFERYQFVQHFYDYVKSNPALKETWSNWAKTHKYETYTPDYNGYIWRIDALDNNTLPRNFRTSDSPFKQLPLPNTNDSNYLPTRAGLNDLKLSGSGQFSVDEFKTLVQQLRKVTNGPIYDIDLRQESHGFFNNNAVSWYGLHDWGNYDKTSDSAIKDEQKRIKKALHTNVLMSPLNKNKKAVNPQTQYITTALTEKKLAQTSAVNYLRITATDHMWPSAEAIDQFIAFYKTLPEDAWLHFHCQAGIGRTTCFMAIYDILKNPTISLKDILYRQYLIGGNYVAHTVNNPSNNNWKADYYNDKARMIQLFYKYVQENHSNNYKMTWSIWLKNNDI